MWAIEEHMCGRFLFASLVLPITSEQLHIKTVAVAGFVVALSLGIVFDHTSKFSKACGAK